MKRRSVIPLLCMLAVTLTLSVDDSTARSANGDTTGASLLGAPPDVITIDPTQGAAGMGLPFEVPPGRAGLQPQLALSYSSGSSEPGAFGRGWTLALPSIRRSTRFGQPQFDWTDTFALYWNGGANDLVLVFDGTVGGVGMREFRTLIETFMRIRSFTDPGGFTHWELWDGAGRRYEFGNPGTDASPTQAGDFLWALNRVEDSHGNYMTVDWLLDAGTLYPLIIRYTGKVGGPGPSNRVEFAYEGRYDVIGQRLGVKAGATQREVRYRLRRVKTFAGGDVASVYLLEYTTPGTGELTSDLCAGVSCGLSSWFCAGTGMTASCPNTCDSQTGFCVACTPNCCGECATITTICPNGGFAACVQECNPSFGCLQCTPNCNPGGGGGGGGCPGCPPMPESPMPLAGAQSSVDYGPSLLASVQRSNNTGSAHLPSIRFTYTADRSAQKLWTLSTNLLPVAFLSKEDTAQARSTFDYGVQMEDVNGDALPDLLMGLGYTCSGAPPRKVYLNRGHSWVEAEAPSWELPDDFVMRDCDHGQYDSGLRLVDVNGDHRPDLVRSYTWNGGPQITTVWINEYGTWIGPKPAADWNVPVPFVAIETSGASGIQSKDLGVRFADVDGDGWTDLVRGRNGTRDVYLNNRGSGWDSATSGGWHPPVDFVYHYPGGDVDVGARLLDLNGDGLADIIQSTLWDGVPTKRVWIGRGRAGLDGEVWQSVSGWDIPQYFSVVNGSNDDSDDLGVRLADVNGDGRVDLIVARRWEGTSTSCTTFGTWGGSTCQTVYLQHAGQGWVEDLEWSAAIPPGYFFIEHKQDYEDYDDGVRVVDVDGNGTVDFLRGLDGWGGGPREWRKNADQFSDLLSSVDNGAGGTSIISYQSSAYTNHTTGTPATRSMDLIFPLVNQVVTSDGQTGMGHTYTTIYSYLSGYYHAPRREFRGFATVSQRLSGVDGGLFRYNLLEESRDVAPLAGVAWRVLLTTANPTAWHYELIRSFDTSHSGPTHFHYLTGTTEHFWDHPPGGPPISRTLRVDYLTTLAQEGDPFVLSRTVRRYGAAPSEDLDVTEEYLNDTTNWRIGLVGRRYTADFHAAPTTPLTQTWFYYDDPDWGEVGATGDLTQIEAWSGDAADGHGADGNRISTMDYDDYGNLIATVDPEQHASTIQYETDNHTYPRQTTVQTDDGGGAVTHTWTYVYDPRFGVQTEATTPGDGAVSYRYDSFGRIVKSWNALDSEAFPTACFEYDFGPPAVRVTTYQREFSGGGSSCGVNGMLATSTFHDGLGRFLQRQSEGDALSTVEVGGTASYDAEGHVASVTLPYRTVGTVFDLVAPPAGTAKTSFLYDKLGRRTQTTLPGGPSTRTVVNKYLGWTVQSFDPQNYKTEVDFDPFGRVRKRRTYRKPVDGGGLYAEVSMDYDRLGRLWRITDPGGNHIEHHYNAFGERRETLDPDMGPIPTEFDYYKDGLLKTLTAPTGQETTYAYDALHRVLREDHTDGTGARYHYDEAAGRPPGAAQPKGHLTSVDGLTTGIRQEMRYNTIGRLSGVTETVDGQPRSIGFAYDALGRLETLTYPDGSGVLYTYKPSGRTAAVWGPVGMSATDTAYTPWGALSHVRYGNGLDVTHEFDPAATWLNGLRACIHCGQEDQVKVVDATFGRDLSGHVTSILDGVNGDNQSFVLDHLYRVETATAPAGYGSLTFQHDTLGNLRQKDGITYEHAVPGMPHRLSDASDGRTFQYDGNGNMEWMAFPSGGTRHYVYDARQQLASVTDSASGVQTLNVFNPSGQRVKRTVVQGGNATTTRFLSNLYEENASGTRKFIYLEGRRIAEVHGASEVFYLVNDQVGSLEAVMGPNGSPVRIRYKPFGEVFGVEGQGFSMAFGFASSRHDEAQGLEDFGARFYDPALGRFLSVDPLLLDPLNLMDQNPYGYARGNPVSFVDVGGLATDDCPADFCASTPPSNPPARGQSTTFSFRWEGSINLGGLWGSLKRPFSRAWDSLQDGYYGLRDGVRGVDFGGAGDEDLSFSGMAGSQAPHVLGPGTRADHGTGGSFDWLVGRDGGAAWFELVKFNKWTRAPLSNAPVPPGLAEKIVEVNRMLPDDFGKNGAHAWHAGTNAAVAQEYGLIGFPFAAVAGLYHESPLDVESFVAEHISQGSLNHLLDSMGDITANSFGYFVGALGSRGTAIQDAIRWGNSIPGPGDPGLPGRTGVYNGYNPTLAWGGY